MFKNQLHNTNWLIDVPRHGADAFVISAQNVIIPNIECEGVLVPINKVAHGMLPGSAVVFTPLQVTVLCDEYLDSYKELFKWMLGNTNWSTGRGNAAMNTKTILVHILDNQKKEPLLTFRFVDAWVSSLGELTMSYSEEGNPAIICSALFSYKYFEIIDSNGIPIKPEQDPKPFDISGSDAPKIAVHPSMR